MGAVAGVDWASDKHDAMVQDADGAVVWEGTVCHDVEFPRFGGHLTTEPFGRSERMSVDAQDPAVHRGVQA
jgi:hypothetical protein